MLAAVNQTGIPKAAGIGATVQRRIPSSRAKAAARRNRFLMSSIGVQHGSQIKGYAKSAHFIAHDTPL